MNLSLVQHRNYKDTFGGGDYAMDVEVNVDVRLPSAKDAPETEEDVLNALLKTERQRQLYEDLKRRCQPG